MSIPKGYVLNKEHVAQLATGLREAKEWVTLTKLEELSHLSKEETRMVIDVLHYTGVIRSCYEDDLEYQWIRN